MDIKCRKTSCVHNKDYNCCAKNVNIDKECNCDTYCRCCSGEDKSKNMFEIAPEYGNSQHIRCKNLTCDCEKCLFNKFNRCQANGITIIDDKFDGICGTYIQDE